MIYWNKFKIWQCMSALVVKLIHSFCIFAFTSCSKIKAKKPISQSTQVTWVFVYNIRIKIPLWLARSNTNLNLIYLFLNHHSFWQVNSKYTLLKKTQKVQSQLLKLCLIWLLYQLYITCQNLVVKPFIKLSWWSGW